jgi:hypothetical protein
MTSIWAGRAVRVGLLAATIMVTAQAPTFAAGGPVQTKPFNSSGLDGFWEIDDSSRRSGARPELTPAGQAIAKQNAAAQAERLARRQVVGLGTYICGLNGAPNIYTTSEPFVLVVTKDEVVQIGERPSQTPRHFYTDGRDWPDFSKMPPSSSGYSIGHWEGNDLVVQTRGMPSGNTPGGALKSPAATMTERFSAVEGGKRLKLTFTIEDPTLLVKPFALTYTFDRDKPHTYAFGDFCDPNDDRGRTVDNYEK